MDLWSWKYTQKYAFSKTIPKHFLNNYKTTLRKARKLLSPPIWPKMTHQKWVKLWRKISNFEVYDRSLKLTINTKVGLLTPKIMPKQFTNHLHTTSKSVKISPKIRPTPLVLVKVMVRRGVKIQNQNTKGKRATQTKQCSCSFSTNPSDECWNYNSKSLEFKCWNLFRIERRNFADSDVFVLMVMVGIMNVESLSKEN